MLRPNKGQHTKDKRQTKAVLRAHSSHFAQKCTALLIEPSLELPIVAYLSPYWQAYHVWMVLDSACGWEKKRFQGADAVAAEYDAGATSIVDGREVRLWTKLELVGGREGASRRHPASDQSLPPSSERRPVPGGWGHEHCDLCKTHIEAGEFGYCDPEGRWLCVRNAISDTLFCEILPSWMNSNAAV